MQGPESVQASAGGAFGSVYRFFVTSYSVAMHVQSGMHEAVLAPLRRSASPAVCQGELWLSFQH